MLGHPVAHTALPGEVAARAATRSADVMLVPLPLRREALPAFLSLLRGLDNCDGAVLTAPLKHDATGLCDTVAPVARKAGAVNLIRRDAAGTLVGDNSDGLGMRRALAAVGFDPAGAHILILGSGAAGAAIAAALRGGDIDLCDRDADRAEAVAARIGGRAIAPPARVAGYDLVLNATPVGVDGEGKVHGLSGLRAGAVAADVLAGPTPFLAQARAAGARTVDGREMALAQMPAILDAFGWGGMS